MPEFMFVSLIVVIWLLMLKHLLMSVLVFKLFWKFQISIQITAMSDFWETLIMYEHEVKTMLLKMCVDLMILLMISEKMEKLVSLMKYGILRIFKWNLD